MLKAHFNTVFDGYTGIAGCKVFLAVIDHFDRSLGLHSQYCTSQMEVGLEFGSKAAPHKGLDDADIFRRYTQSLAVYLTSLVGDLNRYIHSQAVILFRSDQSTHGLHVSLIDFIGVKLFFYDQICFSKTGLNISLPKVLLGSNIICPFFIDDWSAFLDGFFHIEYSGQFFIDDFN